MGLDITLHQKLHRHVGLGVQSLLTTKKHAIQNTQETTDANFITLNQ